MIVNIGLPGWFVATGLGVMVEQPDPRGILCFFVAIFSLATQFDVCPVRLVQSPDGVFGKDREIKG